MFHTEPNRIVNKKETVKKLICVKSGFNSVCHQYGITRGIWPVKNLVQQFSKILSDSWCDCGKINWLKKPYVHLCMHALYCPFVHLLPHDAMHKRGPYCRPVSVHPSVHHIGVFYPHDWRYVKLFIQSDSSIILVFWSPVPIPNSKGNPFSGIFWHWISQKRHKIEPMLL